MIGARPNGEKELLAVEDGYRESAESWKALLRDLKRRGMTTPPLVAVGDGALGFWAAAREVWPETREQGCWCHKLGNVLDKLPQRLQPRAKRTLHEMMYAECRADCEAARARFEAEYQPTGTAKRSELVACNVEIESSICYQSVCLEQRSDCRGSNLRNCRHERARGCCAPVTCAVRG